MSLRPSHRRHLPASRRRDLRRLLLPVALLAGWPGAGTQAEPIDLSFSVASATVLRGVALGEGGVDVQAAASLAHTSGWRAALGAAALHTKAARRRWDAQLFWRLGYAHRLGDDWSVQAAHTYYAYPGSALLRRYGHNELGATLAWRDLLYLSIAGLRRSHADSADYRDSVAADIVARQPLPWSLTASAGIGYQKTRGSGFAYTYGHLGLGAQWGATQAQLSYIATGSAAKAFYGAAAANRWTASLNWEF